MPDPTLRVVTWNLFHGRDGLPHLRATRRSTWFGSPVEDGVHVHLNRKLTAQMAVRIAAWAPDVLMLQEVSRRALREIAGAARLRPVALAATGPLLGPARVRDALAHRNPDLWRTLESNLNAVLVAPPLARVPAGARDVRLNPPSAILRTARRRRLPPLETARWLLEPRRAAIARLWLPQAGELTVASVHLQGGSHPDVPGGELARAARAVEEASGGGPAVLAGDLNAAADHPGFAALAAAGWRDAWPAPPTGIDRILHRGLDVVEAPHRLPPAEREVLVSWRGRTRRVRLSDHDPVVATFRGSGS